MGFVHNTTFPLNKLFTTDELRVVTPDHVYRWMALKAYGKLDPTPADNPTCCRRTTLEYMKKAVSYFMETGIGWVEGTGGNPTKSKLINRLIKAVGKKETRGIGSESKADRPFTAKEYMNIMDVMKTEGSFVDRRRYTAWGKLQLHIIGRQDDMCFMKK